MARIRTIKPEFWTNERVMECSANARLLFIGMWNFADDLGRLVLAPKTIKAQIFPSDDFSFDTVSGMILELSKNGLILIYEVGGKEFLQIVGWQHQRIDKPQPGKCPGPTGELSNNVQGMVATESILPDPIVQEPKPRATISNSEKVLRTDLAEAFGPSRVVDLSRAGLWLSKGYVPSMVLEVVRELLARKPDISSLNYFDAALADRYQRWNAAPQIGDQPSLEDFERAAALFVKDNSKWGNRMGPEPGMGGCRCPTEILIRHGINPKTGLRMQ